MKSAPSSLASSDLASRCSAEARRIAANIAKLPEAAAAGAVKMTRYRFQLLGALLILPA